MTDTKPKNLEKKNQNKKDLFCVLILLMIGLTLLIGFRLFWKPGARVVVKQDGQLIGTYSLLVDQEYTITGSNGTNHLIIKDGTVWMDDASCPDKLCIHMGKISRNGQSIICLPNRVSVEVTGGETTNLDGVSK